MRPVNVTNGPQGITLIDPISFGGISLAKTQSLFGLQLQSVYLYYYFFLFLAIVAIIICIRLQDSRLGRAWMAIREDELAAKAMGINVRNVKLLAFSLGATFGGVAGAMFSAFQGFVSPESFTLNESIIVLAMIVLGGLGHIPGVVLGAVLLSHLPRGAATRRRPAADHPVRQVIVDAEVLRMMLYGLAMVLIMLYRPKGLWPAPEHGVNPSNRRDAGKAQAA